MNMAIDNEIQTDCDNFAKSNEFREKDTDNNCKNAKNSKFDPRILANEKCHEFSKGLNLHKQRYQTIPPTECNIIDQFRLPRVRCNYPDYRKNMNPGPACESGFRNTLDDRIRALHEIVVINNMLKTLQGGKNPD